MRYKINMAEKEMQEVPETTSSKTMVDIIKSKLTKIEYLIMTHHITELVKKQMKEELRQELKAKKK
jgi:DNA-binding LytR/AlgR family response regulator